MCSSSTYTVDLYEKPLTINPTFSAFRFSCYLLLYAFQISTNDSPSLFSTQKPCLYLVLVFRVLENTMSLHNTSHLPLKFQLPPQELFINLIFLHYLPIASAVIPAFKFCPHFGPKQRTGCGLLTFASSFTFHYCWRRAAWRGQRVRNGETAHLNFYQANEISAADRKS